MPRLHAFSRGGIRCAIRGPFAAHPWAARSSNHCHRPYVGCHLACRGRNISGPGQRLIHRGDPSVGASKRPLELGGSLWIKSSSLQKIKLPLPCRERAGERVGWQGKYSIERQLIRTGNYVGPGKVLHSYGAVPLAASRCMRLDLGSTTIGDWSGRTVRSNAGQASATSGRRSLRARI
jgi:hypothetical protein